MVGRLQFIACVPFSELTYSPLLPRSEIVPSAFISQSNCSQPCAVARVQVIACVPFSDDTYLPMLCRVTFPLPASATINCSQACAVVRLQFMACVPFSELTYK